VLLVERDHPVVEEIGGGERGLSVVELGEAELGVGVDEVCLQTRPTPFKVPT